VTRPARVIILAAAMGALPACEEQQTVVASKNMLSGLPGAQSAIPPKQAEGQPVVQNQPTATQLRTTGPNGRVVLNTSQIRDLMANIYITLQNNERDLFTEQLLSQRTTDEFTARGYEPQLAFDELKRRERDVRALFNRMPQGEFTPGVLRETVGEKVYRIRLTGHAAVGLTWNFMDSSLEAGQYKLRWFGAD